MKIDISVEEYLELLKDVWGYIKHDLDVGEIELTEIEKRAINGAAELVQVAAMARKWREMDRAVPVHKLP